MFLFSSFYSLHNERHFWIGFTVWNLELLFWIKPAGELDLTGEKQAATQREVFCMSLSEPRKEDSCSCSPWIVSGGWCGRDKGEGRIPQPGALESYGKGL